MCDFEVCYGQNHCANCDSEGESEQDCIYCGPIADCEISLEGPCNSQAPMISGCGISNNTTSPRLEWSTVNDAVAYQISFSFNSSDNSCFVFLPFTVTTTNNYLNPPATIGLNCFCWSVRAICESGEYGPWSDLICLNHPKNAEVCSRTAEDGDGVLIRLSEESRGNIEGFSFFPNPVQGQATVSFQLTDDTKVHVAVFDAVGQQVQYLELAQLSRGYNQFYLDTSALAAGVYTLQLVSDQGIQSHKFVVN